MKNEGHEDSLDGAMSASPAGVRISLRVIPRSPRTKIDGVREGRLLSDEPGGTGLRARYRTLVGH